MLEKKLRSIVLILALALLISGVTFGMWRFKIFASFDWQLSDKFFIREPISNRVVIVAIDDRSIQAIGRWPWPRDTHSAVVQRLEAAGADVIGYDVTFSERGINDEKFFAGLAPYDNIVFPMEGHLNLQNGSAEFTETIEPLSEIKKKFSVGHTTLVSDNDGIVRRMPFRINAGAQVFEPFFAQVARQSGLLVDEDYFARATLFRIFFFGSRGTFPTHSLIDVLNGAIEPQKFKDKIVLVGSTASDLHDEQFTPLSAGRAISGVEIQANLIESVVQSVKLVQLSDPMSVWVLLLLVSLLAAVGAILFHLRIALLFLPIIFFVYLISASVAFGAGVILPVFYPISAILLVFAAAIGLKYFREEREKKKIRNFFSTYVSKEVVDELLRDSGSLTLGGHRARVSVLFSDIRGFTTISEKLQPEELVTFLNVYLDEMARLVMRARGVVDKFIGDAVMAFWNAPVQVVNHEQAAVETALAMIERLNACRADWRARGFPDINIGVGVNTGDVVVGNVGSEARVNYTIIGDAVNLAARLEALTKFYGTPILVSESVARAADSAFLFRLVDWVAVKGKNEGVKIYDVSTNQILLDLFNSALELYFSTDWKNAHSAFSTIAEQFPDDGPTKVLRERTQEYITNPPPDFDGVFRPHFK